MMGQHHAPPPEFMAIFSEARKQAIANHTGETFDITLIRVAYEAGFRTAREGDAKQEGLSDERH